MALEKYKVLLVDDEPFSRRLMQIYFEKYGFTVIDAGSGKEALDCLDEHQFDLVVTDVMMPGMSGVELLERIRTQQDKFALPIILLTALDDTDQIARALESGADDFVPKSREFKLLLTRVNLQLELKQLRRDAAGPPLSSGATPVTGAGVWSWDLAKNQFHFSRRFKEILGLGAKDLDTRPESWLDRIHSEDSGRVNHALQAHRDRKTPCFEADYRILNHAGTYIWVHQFGIAMFNAEGKANRLVGSLNPWTNSAQSEERDHRQLANIAKLRQALTAIFKSESLPAEVEDALNSIIKLLAK